MMKQKQLVIKVDYEESDDQFAIEKIDIDECGHQVLASVVACILNSATEAFPCFPDHVSKSVKEQKRAVYGNLSE